MYTSSASVIGLGKLGVCLAATFAHNALPVVGADLNETIVEQINAGEAPRQEPHLQEYIDESGDDLHATTDVRAAVRETDITYVVVNTPSTEAGRYSIEYVEATCESIGAALAEKDDYHIVVITSTVFPGSTTGEIQDTLETASGKTAGEEFGLCYSPEFIAIGDVIRGLEDPDFFLLGEHTERAGDVVAAIYDRLGEEKTPIARMDPVNAEVAKMAVNSYVTTKISFVNALAEICDGVGADVDVITESLAMDERISGSYLTAGARYGGPCFPRDNVAFARLAEDAGTDAPIATSTDAINNQHTEWIADAIRDVTESDESVAILGLTYKPGTDIVEESQGMELIEALFGDVSLICHDPMGLDRARDRIGLDSNSGVRFAESSEEALEESDTAVVATQWEEYADPNAYAGYGGTIVDPWGLFTPPELSKGVAYRPIGRPSLERSSER